MNALRVDFSASKGTEKTLYNGFGRDFMKAVMVLTGGLSGGISSTIAGGKFMDGFRQGLITAGLNHVGHLAAVAIDYRNKLEKFLDENKVKRSDPASQETLNKLKIIFKEYWDRSAKWAELATEECIKDWEGSEYKGVLSLEKGKIMHMNEKGKLDWNKGITNPINGKVLLSTALSNQGLASTFIHEMVHSIDVVTGVQRFWNHFSTMGHDYIESRAYMEVAKWEGGVHSQVGIDHMTGAMPIIISTFNIR